VRPRLILADDHRLFSEGISRLLAETYELLGIACDGAELIEKVNQNPPDAIVLDISMPGMNGFQAARSIHSSHPDIKLIFVSVHRDPSYVADAFRAGASAYVSKSALASDLLNAVSEALAGRRYLGKHIPAVDLAEPSVDTTLSDRQREVLRLVARGYSAKVMAHELAVSPKTIEFHKSKIMQKLQLHSTAELIRYAVDMGLVDAD
jgi:DNA-binding NarL/FixJ family response regulator